jgi:histidyl-tRNA synthetase
MAEQQQPDALVKPRLLKGLQDSSWQLALARRRMVERVEGVCRRFGFLPFDTPALEARDALLGPQPTREQLRGIFTFENQDDEVVGMRFDLTVPLARAVSQYTQGELPRPFRRYQSGNVWRYDKPEPGRFREFMQFDIDMVGAPEMTADAEVIAVVDAILRELKVDNYVIRISSRKLLSALGQWVLQAEGAGTSARPTSGGDGPPPGEPQGSPPSIALYRVIDKLDKFDRARIRMELGPGLTDESGAQIEGLGLTDAQIAKVDQFLDLPNEGNTRESLDAVRGLLGGHALAAEALDELEQLFGYIEQFGVAPRTAIFDLHLARGLGYYTGPVFEVTLTDLPQYGSVFGGGRYDGLVERFLGPGQGVPAVGVSVGVDRLLAALSALGRDVLEGEPAGPQVLVTVMDAERMADYIAITRELRAAGIRAELWQGGKAAMGKQFKYADKLDIPLALIAGSNEFAAGEVSVKDLHAGRRLAEDASREEWKEKRPQVTVKRTELVGELQRMLSV